MNKKFTSDTIKDLKMKVSEMNGSLLNYYKQNEFKPDSSFNLVTEQSEVAEIGNEVVTKMVNALIQIDKKKWDEFESGKILFENIKLTPKQASDICFWTYHNHYTFYPYISKRRGNLWDVEKDMVNPSTYINDYWIQSSSSAGDLIRYPISGLWWSFYLTVDSQRDDKYELTKLFFKNDTLRTRQLGSARFARYKPAIIAVLEFIKENNLDNNLEEASRSVVPYINLLGGIRPLAYFNKEWFKDKLVNRFGQQITNKKKLYLRP